VIFTIQNGKVEEVVSLRWRQPYGLPTRQIVEVLRMVVFKAAKTTKE
jgi:hypothetical protein